MPQLWLDNICFVLFLELEYNSTTWQNLLIERLALSLPAKQRGMNATVHVLAPSCTLTSFTACSVILLIVTIVFAYCSRSPTRACWQHVSCLTQDLPLLLSNSPTISRLGWGLPIFTMMNACWLLGKCKRRINNEDYHSEIRKCNTNWYRWINKDNYFLVYSAKDL